MLKRITRKRAALILLLSLIPLLILIYQTYFFYFIACDLCRENRHIFGIPISLLGVGYVILVLSEISVIALLPTPFPFYKNLQISYFHLKNLFKILIIHSILIIFVLLGLAYVELSLIGFCGLCTISQVVIMVNNVLIFTWRPFAESFNKK